MFFEVEKVSSQILNWSAKLMHGTIQVLVNWVFWFCHQKSRKFNSLLTKYRIDMIDGLLVPNEILIERSNNSISVEPLREKDPWTAIGALRSLPRDLTSTYENIIQCIERHSNRHLVMRTISWLFHVQRPLLMREIQEALSVYLSNNVFFNDYFISPPPGLNVAWVLWSSIELLKSFVLRIT